MGYPRRIWVRAMGGSSHGQAGEVAQILLKKIGIFRDLFRAKLKFLGVNLG
jgi:hypothetical protein